MKSMDWRNEKVKEDNNDKGVMTHQLPAPNAPFMDENPILLSMSVIRAPFSIELIADGSLMR